MPDVTVRAVIPAPRNEVFAFVADMENDPLWVPLVSQVKRESGDGGEGTVWSFQQQAGKRTTRFTSTLLVKAVPDRLEWRFGNRRVDVHSTMTFEEVAGGTRVTQHNVSTWDAPWLVRLMAPVLTRRALRRQMRLLQAHFKE
ncbi:MAG: SRPBCC family protein [Thermoplasmatota archaeon]